MMTTMLKIGIFVTASPMHVWMISALFGVLTLGAWIAKTRYPRIRSLPLFVVCLIWVGFSYYQSTFGLALAGQGNIRIDLALTVPVLLCGTALLIVFSIWNIAGAIRRNRQPRKDGSP
jgi:hypothetical protein